MEFGLELLRDLPDLEALKDAGLMRADSQPGVEDEEAEAAATPNSVPLSS